MQPIPQEYSVLFNEITDVSEELIKLYKRLIEAQRRAEDAYIDNDEAEAEVVLRAEHISANT